MNLLLVMLSTQLYSPSATAEAGAHPFTEVLMDGEDSACRLVLLLLQHFVARRALPANAPIFKPPSQQQRGVLRFVRSAAGDAPSVDPSSHCLMVSILKSDWFLDSLLS